VKVDRIGYGRGQVTIFNTIFVSSHLYPENPEETQVIVGSMNMGYISDTARDRTHNLFRRKREPIPLGHSDGRILEDNKSRVSGGIQARLHRPLSCRHVMK